MKHLEWMVLIFLIPLPMFACSLREIPIINIRSTVISLFNSEPEEELVRDRIVVTPLATLTPTSTPTFTSTLQSIPSVQFLPSGPASPPAAPGDLPPSSAAESSTGSGSEETAGGSSTLAPTGPLPPPTLPPTPVPSLVPTVLPSPSLSPVPTATPEPPPTLTPSLPPPPPPPPADDDDDDDDDDTPPPEPSPIPPVLAFATALYNVNEMKGAAVITVSLNTPSSQLITVDYATGDDTATAGRDYTAVNGTLAITPGLASATFVVPILNDLAIEPDQSLTLLLSDPVNTLLGLNTATLLIIDTCTLPDAITAANTDRATGGCGAGSGDDTIDLEIPGPIDLNGPLPNLSSNIVINAPNKVMIRRATGGDYRIFTIDSGSTVIISGVTVANGRVSGNGGGIFNSGTLTLVNSDVINSSAIRNGGGGIYVALTSTMTLNNSRVDGNSADFDGGGIFVEDGSDVSITGSTISNNRAGDRGGGIFGDIGSVVSITDGIISGNSVERRGGGIATWTGSTMTLNNSLVDGNSAEISGGGIFVDQASTASLSGSMVSNNNTVNDGGGIFNLGDVTLMVSTIKGNTASRGGGIYNGAIFIASHSTINNNTVHFPIGKGGGINHAGSDMTLTNVTISHNTAADDGGGLEVVDGSPTLIRHSTIVNNTADGVPGEGGGIFYFSGPDVITVFNTVIANNFAAGSPNRDCFGLVSSLGYNLSSDNSCFGFTATGDLTNTDPLLDSLQNNGGPTETHALLPGSLAIDAGSCAGVTTDQRGENRPIEQPEPNVDDGCDIGAFELQ